MWMEAAQPYLVALYVMIRNSVTNPHGIQPRPYVLTYHVLIISLSKISNASHFCYHIWQCAVVFLATMASYTAGSRDISLSKQDLPIIIN